MDLNRLKKTVFYEMLNMAGRVFIVVKYSDDAVIGTRGFTSEEKQNGIVLVFNKSMSFTWDDFGIAVTLVFGTIPQECFIPQDDILIINSPELSAQFIAAPQPLQEKHAGEDAHKKTERMRDEKVSGGSNVVMVDFGKKKDKSHVPHNT